MAMGWGIGQNHHPLVSMIFIKNYGITEFYYFYQELRNYIILFFLSRITELQNSIIFIKNYGITEFYYFYQELRNYRILLSECGPSDGFFFNSLILDKIKRIIVVR